MSIFASHKDAVCKEMDVVYHGLWGASQARIQYAKGWETFGETSAAMLTSQIPEMQSKFDELKDLFKAVADIHLKLSAEEARNADDFRDVIERYEVIYRVTEEYNERKVQWKTACDNFENKQKQIEMEKIKGTFTKNQYKLEGELAKCKQDKIDFLRRIKRKVNQLIHVKEAYSRFKVNRFRAGFTRYANALKEASEAEAEAFEKIRDYLNDLRVESPEAADAAESAFNEQASKPAPEANFD